MTFVTDPPTSNVGTVSLAPEATDGEPIVVFAVGSATLAVPAALVDEICDRMPTSPIPLSPPHIPGLMAIRGDAVPLIDTARFFQLSGGRNRADVELERPLRVVIVQSGNMRVGLCCDRVLGVEPIPRNEFVKPEVTLNADLLRFATAEVHRIDHVIVRIDVPRLLDAARIKS